MKILIITEGGRRIGFGHVSRCIALLEGFREYLGNSDKIVFLVNGDKSLNFLFRVNHITFINEDWTKKRKKIKTLLEEADLVVIDSYLVYKRDYDFIYSQISNHTKYNFRNRLICIDDYNRLAYPSSLVVNPSVYGDSINYSKKQGNKNKYLLGKDYVILRKEFWCVSHKAINQSIKDILIICSGIDYSDFIKNIITRLSKKFSFNYHVILSKKINNLHLLSESKVHIYSDISSKEIRNLMLKCDICISGGGQTLYELASVGLPTVGVCFATNQIRALGRFQKEGFLKYIGQYKNKNINDLCVRIEKAIGYYMPYDARIKSSNIGKKLIDGKGASRIAKEVFSMDKGKHQINIRKAKAGDCHDLWLWRKHLRVLSMSFYANSIPYIEHKQWFEKKIDNKSVKIYIAEIGREKIGVVRFEIYKNTYACVNVNLNPKFFGKGLGNLIIEMTTCIFIKENNNIKEIKAEILTKNIASQKAFGKAGYCHVGCGIKNDKPIAIFKYKS